MKYSASVELSRKNFPPSEDIKKLERRVKSQEKKMASQAGKLPDTTDGGIDDGE